MKPLVIIIPYFGTWPFWFSAFLQSCRSNREVDWVFYTDCETPECKPTNTRFIELSFDCYKEFVSSRLGIKFNPENPYKICDIKPLLGYIHFPDIEGYKFWAFGDIDVIYGDLLSFYMPLMKKYKLISGHETRISGHLCLLENSKTMISAFKKVKKWEAIISNPEHCCFDEKYFTRLFIKHKNWPKFARSVVNKFNSLRSSAFFEEAYTTPNCRIIWHDGTRNFPQVWKWSNRRLSNGSDIDREYPYLHFMFWKGEIWPKVSDKSSLLSFNNEATFNISQDGIHP